MSKKRTSEEKKLIAYDMYMKCVPNQEIAQQAGYTISGLNSVIQRNGWKVQRDKMMELMQERSKQEIMLAAPQINRLSVGLIVRSLEKKMEKEEELTIQEKLHLMSMMEKLQRMTNLYLDKPTEIVSGTYEPKTLKDLLETIKKDPFIDAEFEEVE